MCRSNAPWPAALAALALLALGTPAGSQALTPGEEAYRTSARGHARALAQAWRAVERHILHDSTAATAWSGDTPPAAAGWSAAWTARGLRARYCDDVLLVWYGAGTLLGVGADQRAVQAAPAAYAPAGRRGLQLHWLDSGVAEGSPGRPAVTLPGCMAPATLPSGRAALAGAVRDPYANTFQVLSRETRTRACPAGEHGGGVIEVREIRRQRIPGRFAGGGPAYDGSPAVGPWTPLVDQCVTDYTVWEEVAQACSWAAGPPHNRTMHGQDVWRRQKTVTGPMQADGQPTVTYGTPVFVSSSCWGTSTPPAPPSPSVQLYASTETQPWTCPSGWSGTASRSRTVTERHVRWPWDGAPTRGWHYASWVVDDSLCIPPAPCAEAPWDETAGSWDSSACEQETADNCRWETDNWVCPEGEETGGGHDSFGMGGSGGTVGGAGIGDGYGG